MEVTPLSSSEQPSEQLNHPLKEGGFETFAALGDGNPTAIAADKPLATSESLEEFPDDIAPLFSALPTARGFPFRFLLIALASLGLHAGIMLLPTGEEAKKTPPKPPEQQIRITQLPSLKQQLPVKRPPPPKPVVKRTLPPPLERTRTTPPPPVVKPSPSPSPSTSATSDKGQASEPASGENPWKDFPIYPGSTPGCFELSSCLQASVDFGQVAAHFNRELPAKKYEAKRTIQEADRQVYQVSRNGLTQFLSILENGKQTVYVLSDAPRTLDDLEKAVEVPPEIYAILLGLAVQQSDPSYFAQPDLFYTKAADKSLAAGSLIPKEGIRNVSLVSGQAADTMMDEFLRSNLQNSEFEVTDLPQQYGGGQVYQVQKGGQSFYLNLVPTKDKSGTLLVIWKTPPG